MRSPAALALALLTAALAAAPAPASAGGAPAPERSGGAAYGSAIARPAAHPIARRLALAPRAITANAALPQISFRVDQPGMEQVQVRVVVLRLPRNAPVARMALGWVKTGRVLRPGWPKGTSLRPGRYLVRVHVKDSRGRTLRRTAQSSGRRLLVVHRAPVVAPPAGRPVIPPPSPLLPAPAPSPGGKGVFPVASAFDFGGTGSRFGSGRTGHIHEGQDISAAQGTPVVAPYAGTVSRTAYQAGGAGEYVVLDAVDGRDYFFAHCVRRSTAVAEGALVGAGAPLCQVGSTGSSSGAHLHFEIWTTGWRVEGGHPIDPLPELRAWSGR
jgi:murein DD-endopeptidase MepM/ murein hydrolase activator NlpD